MERVREGNIGNGGLRFVMHEVTIHRRYLESELDDARILNRVSNQNIDIIAQRQIKLFAFVKIVWNQFNEEEKKELNRSLRIVNQIVKEICDATSRSFKEIDMARVEPVRRMYDEAKDSKEFKSNISNAIDEARKNKAGKEKTPIGQFMLLLKENNVNAIDLEYILKRCIQLKDLGVYGSHYDGWMENALVVIR